MSSSASHVPGAVLLDRLWLDHTDVLYRLYIIENRTLSEVKLAMESQYRFPVLRIREYELALREILKFRKNLKKEEWNIIGAHISYRKRQAKESEVLWNNSVVASRKVRKEVLRNRKQRPICPRMTSTRELPAGVIIRTPPSSPSSIVLDHSGLGSTPESTVAVPPLATGSTLPSHTYKSNTQTAIEPAQIGASRFRELRKNVPFNRFMLQLLDLGKSATNLGVSFGSSRFDNFLLQTAESHPLLALVPTAHVWIPEPRMFGFNPSLEILARITFKLSNKFWIDWTTGDSGWFLNWFGVSADLTMLRAFFSANTPTVWAVYEGLCDVVRHLRRSAAARVLFEILTIVRSNNAIVGDGPNFLEVAVELGSRADGMVEIATRALAHYDSVHVNEPCTRRQRLRLLLMIAAARCDMPLLRLLVDAFVRSDDGASFGSSHGPKLVALIMRRLYSWSEKEDDGLADYMGLLIRGGVLSTSLPARCCYLDRPQVPIRTPHTFTVDELVMICPPKQRPRLYSVALRLANKHRAFVSNAGVFAAAPGGVRNLKAYLQSCKVNNDFEIHETLQESLLFAAALNDTETASALLQMGVDAEVSLLSHNQERYHKGDVSWNPMVVAAAAGNLETLKLLMDKADLRLFLTSAPIYEIVQQENTQIRCGEAMGKELLRLENLRRHYTYSQAQNADVTSASERVFIEPFHGVGTVLAAGDYGGMTHPLFFSVEKRRLETLALIRKIAIRHGACGIVDKEIIEAALFNDPENRATQCQNPAYHPCDCLLLEGLVDANMIYHEDGMDLLQLSIRNQCSMKVVEFLMSKGMNLHSRPDVQTGNTMLHDALLSQSPDRFEIVELLLREGVEYKHCGDGLTVLEASLYGKDFRNQQGPFTERLEIFERLLDAGAPVSCRPRPQLKKWRPLLCLLLDADADDDLILRVADAGADLNENVCDLGPEDNRTPLQRAVADGRDTLAKELIRLGANIHAPAGHFRGYTVLQAACKFDHPLQFVEYLVSEQGANVDEAPARISGMSALQWAAFRGSLSLAEFLLHNGADVNGLSGNVGVLHGENQMVCRRRALDYAALAGRLDMVEFLLRAGGRSGTGGLERAIDAAKINGHFAVLSVLLEWEEKYGKRIVEEEAEWQRQNPDEARLLSEP